MKSRRKQPGSADAVPEDQAEAVDKALGAVWARFAGDASKSSVADLIRLMQLRQELKGDKPRHITVRWVEEWNPILSEE